MAKVAPCRSPHHQLCGWDLQFLIQTRMAPPGPPPSVLSPFLPATSLLHSSKLLRGSSASLLHLAFWLPKLSGKGNSKPRDSPLPCQSHIVPSFAWLPRLGLNPSANLPLHFISDSSHNPLTPASIPIFFQLFWAAIISLGRSGPMV